MPRQEPESSLTPRLAVRVGVTGHRLNKLAGMDEPALRERVRDALLGIRRAAEEVLAQSSGVYAAAPPLVRVITPLAEGADRVVAEEALALGMEIQCPLPFLREVYEADFADEASRAHYRSLLERASAVLETGRPRTSEMERQQAYEAVGGLVLANSDALIAVWGGDAEKAGGTGQVVHEAQALGLPVLWIDAAAPHAVRSLAGFPAGRPADGAQAFTVALAGRLQLPGGAESRHARRASVDELANRYAFRYRASFILNYSLAALAVALSLAGYALSIPEESWSAFVIGELVVIAAIIAITFLGNRRRWHEKWINTRLLAERLRQMEFLAPFGLTPPDVPAPPHHGDGTLDEWCIRHLNAVVREAGMRSARLDPATRAAHARALASLLEEQAAYHHSKAARSEALVKRLEHIGYGLFGVTFVACAAHLLLHGPEARLLTFVAAVFPAIGAALAGILNQGEYLRIAMRSRGMEARLHELARQATRPQAALPGSLEELASQAGQTMTAELMEWRVLFLNRRLALPV
jgi:hypothetical protein